MPYHKRWRVIVSELRLNSCSYSGITEISSRTTFAEACYSFEKWYQSEPSIGIDNLNIDTDHAFSKSYDTGFDILGKQNHSASVVEKGNRDISVQKRSDFEMRKNS
jgi:hypothetical protein